MSDISFAQFDLLSAMQADDFVVGYRGTREVRLTYLSLISGISGVNVTGTGGLDINSLTNFLSTNNVVLSAGTVITNLSVGGSLFTNTVQAIGTGVPTLSSNTSINLAAADRVYVNQSPFRVYNISTADRAGLSPLIGDLIYNTTTNTFQGYSSTGWVDLS